MIDMPENPTKPNNIYLIYIYREREFGIKLPTMVDMP